MGASGFGCEQWRVGEVTGSGLDFSSIGSIEGEFELTAWMPAFTPTQGGHLKRVMGDSAARFGGVVLLTFDIFFVVGVNYGR